jgi:hypothetical protein
MSPSASHEPSRAELLAAAAGLLRGRRLLLPLVPGVTLGASAVELLSAWVLSGGRPDEPTLDDLTACTSDVVARALAARLRGDAIPAPPPAPDEALDWEDLGTWAAGACGLAVPGLADEIAAALAGRVIDLHRALVLALLAAETRRAARILRWLALFPDTPGLAASARPAAAELARHRAGDPEIDYHLAVIGAVRRR